MESPLESLSGGLFSLRRRVGGALICALLLAALEAKAGSPEIVVSVADQELALIERGHAIMRYPISTSKFGNGDGAGTYRTPLGVMYVSAKLGEGLPSGAVIKSRSATGEVIPADAPGRDPIVSRVLWLRGKEEQNRNARERCIYITAPRRRNASDAAPAMAASA